MANAFKRMYGTPGKRIKWGVFKEDVEDSVSAISEGGRASAREAAARDLTNIDLDERARRGFLGKVFSGITVLTAIAQIATDQPALARTLIAAPLFFAVGFLGSEKTGL